MKEEVKAEAPSDAVVIPLLRASKLEVTEMKASGMKSAEIKTLVENANLMIRSEEYASLDGTPFPEPCLIWLLREEQRGSLTLFAVLNRAQSKESYIMTGRLKNLIREVLLEDSGIKPEFKAELIAMEEE